MPSGAASCRACRWAACACGTSHNELELGPANAVDVTVSSGGEINVNFGGTAIGTTINGGDINVYGSGTAIGTTIASGGTLSVSGGVASGTMISGGEEIVNAGYTVNTTVLNGGALVLSGTEASGTTVGAGGVVYGSGFWGGWGGNRTLAGGLTVDTTVLSGGLDVVEGVASGAVLSGGEMVVSSGGMVFGTTVGSGGTLVVLSGATDGGFVFTDVAFSGGVPYRPDGLAGITGYTTVSGGTEILQGTATSDTVEAGGTLVVSGSGGRGSTGFATFDTVGSGGTVVITGSGGWARFDRVGSGGTEVVSGGGMSESAIISSGGELVASSGGTEWGATVNGGVEVVASGGSASNDTIDSGGHEVIQSGGAAAVGILTGTVEVTGGGDQVGVGFMSGGTGTLLLDASTSFHGLVAGFGTGDQIDLKDVAFVATTNKGQKSHVLSYTSASGFGSGTLTVTDGVHTANIQLLGSYIASEFAAASDGHGGTLITFTPPYLATGGHGNAITTPVTS
jgi:fibronectin-binding autotransporter adhesin